jgi:hypothetical protein
MPRKAGDGRGRIGGRAPGTPNKDKPLKVFLREHSLEYFTPSIEEVIDGKKTGRMISQYDKDVKDLAAADRVDAEIKLLKFHTPQMQATAVDLSVAANNVTLSERIARLARGEDIAASDE